MATYLELKAKAEKLLAEAEELRIKELQEVIDDIKQKIANYGLTAKDLGFSTGGGAGRGRKSGSKSGGAVKYRGPNGETWSGGRGRKPKWLVDELAKGRKLEDFLVQS